MSRAARFYVYGVLQLVLAVLAMLMMAARMLVGDTSGAALDFFLSCFSFAWAHFGFYQARVAQASAAATKAEPPTEVEP